VHLKHGYISFGYTEQLNMLVVLGWVGLGRDFSVFGGLV